MSKFKSERTPQSGAYHGICSRKRNSWFWRHDTVWCFSYRLCSWHTILFIAAVFQVTVIAYKLLLVAALHWGLVAYQCCAVYLGAQLGHGASPLIQCPSLSAHCPSGRATFS